ncbi:Zn-binding domain-containing protein [Brevibacterium paucivorans]
MRPWSVCFPTTLKRQLNCRGQTTRGTTTSGPGKQINVSHSEHTLLQRIPLFAGFAERGFEVFEQWQRATLDAIDACECVAGCPSCVQSPKCGNGNEPLDKDAALRLLREVLR